MEPTTTDRPLRHAVRHYLEMVLAMCVGMIVLGGVGVGLAVLLGLPATYGAEIDALLMATTMAAGMAVWMRHRGHSWIPVAQMSGSMYVAFGILFVPLWMSLITPSDLMLWGHVLMLPAMAGAMLLRPGEYTRPHRHA
ncbi:hypothetical protein WIS52_21130 [Pseudonocardia nematodicida]|uniref:Flagellar biosynthetic protein FliP n=1 Tax=Pseudonocardia nematodicida TaxID=1206997 RepID=A0ABV1KET0_9PSEU